MLSLATALARKLALLTAALGALVHAGNAGTLTVGPVPGPGVDFTSIQAAVDAAVDGDVLEIAGGTYFGPVVIDGKSIALQGFRGCTLSSSILTSTSAAQLIVRNLAAHQAVEIRNFGVFRAGSTPGACVGLENNLGRVWLEELFVTNLEGDGVTIVDSRNVLLSEAFVFAERAVPAPGGGAQPATAVRIAGQSYVGAAQSIFAGSSAAPIGQANAVVQGGDALVATGGEVVLDAVVLQAGDGTSALVGGCLTGASAGRALVVEAAPFTGLLVRQREVTLLAGTPGAFDPSCAAAPAPVPALVDPSNLAITQPGPTRKLTMPSLPYPNGAFEFQYEGAAGDVFALFVSKPTQVQQMMFFQGDVWLEITGAHLMFIGQASATGFGGAVKTYANPGPPLTLHVQGFVVDQTGLPWLTTPGTIYFP